MAGGGGWPFRDGEVHVSGRLRLNSLEGIRRAVLEHIGIAYLPSWMVVKELRSGELRALLGEHAAARSPLNAVYSAERLLPRRAAVFIDFVAELCAATPGLDGGTLRPPLASASAAAD
jgi:DNA-binding transcriptional LysR family regulator